MAKIHVDSYGNRVNTVTGEFENLGKNTPWHERVKLQRTSNKKTSLKSEKLKQIKEEVK